MSSGEKRKCIECQKSFDESEFPVSKGGRNAGKRGSRCASCAAERAAWAREWYGRNKEKAKESGKRWREKQAPARLSRKPRQLTEEQLVSRRAANAAWKKANPERMREYRRRYYAARKAERVAAGLPTVRVYKVHDPCTFCGDLKHYAKGLCRGCYARRLKRGTPEYRVKPGETIEEKFRRRYQVDETTGCWVWDQELIAGKPPYFSGRNARVFAYESINGPQAKNLRISMSCGNDRCVNPAHMTARVKPGDAEKASLLAAAVESVEAGRETRKEAARRLYSSGLVYQEIAEAFGLTRQRIEQIVHFTPRRRKRTELAYRTYLIARLRRAGASAKEIAEALALGEGLIKSMLTRYRIRADGSYVPPMEGLDPASFNVPDAVLALEAELRQRWKVEKPRVLSPIERLIQNLEAENAFLRDQLAAMEANERGEP